MPKNDFNLESSQYEPQRRGCLSALLRGKAVTQKSNRLDQGMALWAVYGGAS